MTRKMSDMLGEEIQLHPSSAKEEWIVTPGPLQPSPVMYVDDTCTAVPKGKVQDLLVHLIVTRLTYHNSPPKNLNGKLQL